MRFDAGPNYSGRGSNIRIDYVHVEGTDNHGVETYGIDGLTIGTLVDLWSKRGAELTQRLLAFSRKQTLHPSTVDTRRLVGGMDALLRRTLGETITIETRSSGDLWPCEADPVLQTLGIIT